MPRKTEEYQEPNYMCPTCGNGCVGNYCPNCELTYEEAVEEMKRQWQEKKEEFLQACFDHGVARPDPHGNRESLDFEEIEVGDSIKIVPRFTIIVSELMEIPGVEDIYFEGRGAGPTEIKVKYERGDK